MKAENIYPLVVYSKAVPCSIVVRLDN